MREQINMAAHYEHEIPEGYEARIEGNKVVIERKESEFELRMKEIRALYIAMQEQGVDDRYGDALSVNLPRMIKWLTDKIELAKREREFSKAVHTGSEELTPFENGVLKMIDDIAKCITYPNNSCIPNVHTVASELLALARKELFANDTVLKEYAEVSREPEAMKDLPRWKKYPKGTEIDPFAVVRFPDGNIGRSRIAHDGYYVLEVSEMLKLPGFND